MITHRTPLIEIEPDPSRVRQAAVANALWARDLRAADEETEPKLRELLGNPGRFRGYPVPWDLAHRFEVIRRPDGSVQTKGVSTCGLVASGLLLRLLALPWDGHWYWGGPGAYKGHNIVVCLGILGDQAKAKRPVGHRPRPGDPACIGTGYATHVLSAIEDDGEKVVSIDGGQIDKYVEDPRTLQRTRRCERIWSACRVNWVLDLEILAARYPRRSWIVPEGWEEVELVEEMVPVVAYQLGTTRGVQQALRDLGYDVGAADGIQGPRTTRAVKSFQSHEGLVADGIVGRLTRAALAAALSTS